MLCFIVLCLSIAQYVVDSVPWCANTSGDYYDDHAREEILEDLQPAEEEREWYADDVEWCHHTWHKRVSWGLH